MKIEIITVEVLFVSHKFPPSTGGMERQSLELVSGMERKCKVHRLVYEKKEMKASFFLLLNKRIKELCRKNPDITLIHFNDALIASWYSFFNFKDNTIHVATLHGLDVVFPSSIYHRYIFKRLNRYARLVAVSHATAQKAIELGIAPEKLSVIPNGVNISQARNVTQQEFEEWQLEKGINPNEDIKLAMLGRAVSRKGFSWFANQVMPQLGDGFSLFMAGPFRFTPSFRERLIYLLPYPARQKLMLFLGYASDEREIRRALKLSSKVKHVGRISSEEIAILLQHADVFLMPNIHIEGDMEGFGLVCLEAAVQGTLVFAADTDGIPDAIRHNKNGFLLPSGDALRWSERLQDFAKNKAEYAARKQEFADYTRQNYNWEKMVDTYHALFLKMEHSKSIKRELAIAIGAITSEHLISTEDRLK